MLCGPALRQAGFTEQGSTWCCVARPFDRQGSQNRAVRGAVWPGLTTGRVHRTGQYVVLCGPALRQAGFTEQGSTWCRVAWPYNMQGSQNRAVRGAVWPGPATGRVHRTGQYVVPCGPALRQAGFTEQGSTVTWCCVVCPYERQGFLGRKERLDHLIATTPSLDLPPPPPISPHSPSVSRPTPWRLEKFPIATA